MILAIVFILFTIPFAFSRTEPNVIFPKKESIKIRGPLSILIVLHHCSYNLQLDWYDNLFGNIGMWVCAIFFMQSGYAFYTNRFKYSQMSFPEFFKKRISGLLADYLIISSIYVICTIITHNFHLQAFWAHISHGNTTQILPYSWFIIELIVLYIISFLSIKTKIPITSTIIWSIAIMIAVYKLGFGCEWWMSTMAYPLGVIVKRLESISMFTKYHHILTPPIALITIALSISNILYDNLFVWLLNILLIAYTLNYQMTRIRTSSKLMDYLAALSNYVYMFQGFAIVLIAPKLSLHGVSYLLAVLFITIVFAISYQTIKYRILNGKNTF